MPKRIKHLYLDYSSYNEYLKCPRRFAWSLVEGLVPQAEFDPSLAAYFKGSLVHECIDAVYSGVDWKQKFEELLAEPGIKAIHELTDERSGSKKHLANLINRYMNRYEVPQDTGYEITATERKLEMPLADWLTWTGTVDKEAVRRSDQRRCIIDHKTSSSLSRFVEPQVAVSDQFTGYIALARANGIPTNTLVVDGISTALKALKDGQGLFTRYTTERTDEQLAEWRDRVLFVASRIRDDIENSTFISNQPSGCNLFGSQCQFYDACATSGTGRLNVLRSSFTVTDTPWKNFKISWDGAV